MYLHLFTDDKMRSAIRVKNTENELLQIRRVTNKDKDLNASY